MSEWLYDAKYFAIGIDESSAQHKCTSNICCTGGRRSVAKLDDRCVASNLLWSVDSAMLLDGQLSDVMN